MDFTHEEEIDFDTFCKVELRVAEVRACENLKESKKLLHLTVFDGERERCILSGIAKWFKPEDLIGKKIGIVCNLAPRPMMKGKYVSEGMIFAADTADGGCSIAFYGDDTPGRLPHPLSHGTHCFADGEAGRTVWHTGLRRPHRDLLQRAVGVPHFPLHQDGLPPVRH
mgnify:CR=1 FL=1